MATITLKPEYKQHLAYQALQAIGVDTIFLGGGAGGGKSWLICESRLINCYLYPGYKSYIGREELKRLMQSTYLTWVKVCAYHKIPRDDWKLNGQYNYIEFKNGSRIDLLDLKFLPADPLYERFGSLEYTDGAIEEAGEVDFLAYDVLKSRVGRHLNKELSIKPSTLITGNPKKNWTYTEFYKPWKNGTLGADTVFIQSLYSDNSYTAEQYGEQLSKIKDKATKQRLMYGNWEYDDDPATMIDYDSITDLFTNTVDESNDRYMTIDVARLGKDKTVIYCWEGFRVYKIVTYEKQDLDTTNIKIRDLARDERIPFSHIIADEDGVGGGVVDGVKGIKGFVANSRPLENKLTHDEENYKNLKAQCYYKLADYINNRLIAIDTEDIKFKEDLTQELEQVKAKDLDKDGKKQIIPKDEVKEIIGRSPDYSDTLMFRMWFELKRDLGVIAPVYVPNAVDRNPNYEVRTSLQLDQIRPKTAQQFRPR